MHYTNKVIRGKDTRALNWMAPSIQTFCIEKTHIWKPFNVLIPLNDAFLFKNKEI